VKEKYLALEKLLRSVAQARQDNKVAIAKLQASSKDYAPEYVKNFITPKIAEANAGMEALRFAGHEKVMQLLADIQKLAEAKQSRLDLSNPAWANALKLIELSGKDIDADTVRKINAQFSTDQAALRALRTIYKNQGVLYDGGIADMLYEPEATMAYLGQWAYEALIREGSLNEFSREISKVAAKEGIDFPTQLDDVGATNVLRTAAGLPDK
jgi:hypothetical protein